MITEVGAERRGPMDVPFRFLVNNFAENLQATKVSSNPSVAALASSVASLLGSLNMPGELSRTPTGKFDVSSRIKPVEITSSLNGKSRANGHHPSSVQREGPLDGVYRAQVSDFTDLVIMRGPKLPDVTVKMPDLIALAYPLDRAWLVASPGVPLAFEFDFEKDHPLRDEVLRHPDLQGRIVGKLADVTGDYVHNHASYMSRRDNGAQKPTDAFVIPVIEEYLEAQGQASNITVDAYLNFFRGLRDLRHPAPDNAYYRQPIDNDLVTEILLIGLQSVQV